MSGIRQTFVNSGLEVDTTDILMASWRNNTKDKYDTYIKQWLTFCNANNISSHQATANDGLKFLTQVFKQGRSYSSINGARSALSAILTKGHEIPFGKLPLVSKFMRGVANLRPTIPKYTCIWDVKVLLDKFRKMSNNCDLTLKELSQKLTTLLTLILCQRAQTIHTFDIKYIRITHEGFHVGFPSMLKQTRPGYHLKPIYIPKFNQEPKICPLITLKAYLNRTEEIRKDVSQLLISYIKPYSAITSKTVSRWLKETLTDSGIDVSIFQGHSVRSAGASAAKDSGVPLPNIMNMAGWTSEKTFAKHYDKPINKELTQEI